MFQFERSEREGVAVLTLAGNLDAATSAGLKKEVVTLTDSKRTRVAVDLGPADAHRFDGRRRPHLAVQARPRRRRRRSLRGAHRAAQGDLSPPRLDRSLDLAPVARRSAGQAEGLTRMALARRASTGSSASRRFSLDAPCLVGRGPYNHVVLDDTRISRQHAKISPEPGGHVVYDLNSANGTFVNDVQVKRQKLTAGDVLRFGPVHLQVRVGGARSAPGRSRSAKFMEVHTQVGRRSAVEDHRFARRVAGDQPGRGARPGRARGRRSQAAHALRVHAVDRDHARAGRAVRAYPAQPARAVSRGRGGRRLPARADDGDDGAAQGDAA